MKPSTKKWVMFLVGMIVTIVALWYSTREVNFREMLAAFRTYRLVWLVPAFVTFYYSMYLRAVRWGLLFEPHYHLKGYQVFPAIMICFGFNCILPGRVGEVARAYLVGRTEKTGITTALATVVAERILDAVTLLSMLAISLSLLPAMDPKLSYVFGKYTLNAVTFNQLLRHLIQLCAVLTIGVIVFMIPAVQLLMVRVIRRLPAVPHALRLKLEHLLMQFAQGFHALRRPSVLWKIVFHTIVLWLLVAISDAVAARGFGFQMSLIQGMALMTLIGIFILIPAAPGYWGLFEAGTIFSLKFMGIGADDSQRMAYALVIHLLQYVPIVVVGLFYASRARVKPNALGETENLEERV